MKILLFGGTGYLAGFVTTRLAEAGHDVVSVRRNATDPLPDGPGITAATCANPRHARALIGEVRPDVVLNMANFFSKTSTPVDVERFAAVNCELVAELCQGAVDTGATLFHVGSAWQATFDDGDPSWGSTYALFKGLAAQTVEWFARWHALSTVTLNLFDTYGPRDPRGKVVQFLIDNVGGSTPLELSDGHQILELVHVADVADAVAAGVDVIASARATSDTPPINAEYWCYPTAANTLREVVATLDELTGTPLAIAWGARPYRIGEQFERVVEGRPRVPGWEARVTLREGLADVLASGEPRT